MPVEYRKRKSFVFSDAVSALHAEALLTSAGFKTKKFRKRGKKHELLALR